MGETNGDNKKKTAREIIENYNGPKVRIMEVCGTHTHEIFVWESANCCRNRWS